MLAGFTPDQRIAALQVLDALTRPLKRGEVEGLLRRAGVQHAKASKIAAALSQVDVVAIVGSERDG